MKPGTFFRWVSSLGAAAFLFVGDVAAADVHVMISAGFYSVYSELGPAIPAELQPGFVFAGALTSVARQPEAANALIRFLASPEAAPAILKAGLAPATAR